ncbi:MAG: hypothetical protein HPY55_00845 [Firmicutes bacterium]|nr:hypothetical protein [Bacillota bacterium]
MSTRRWTEEVAAVRYDDIGPGKGLVIKVQGSEYYVVSRDCRYLRLRVRGVAPRPGDIVWLPATYPSLVRIAIAASVLLVIALGTAAVALQRQPVAYIALDINPSVELGLNRWERVVTTRAFNHEGSLLLNQVSLNGTGMISRPAGEALASIVEAAIEHGFLSREEDNVIQVALLARERHSQAMEESLREQVATVLEKRDVSAYLKVRRASLETRDAARKENLTVNAHLLKKEVQAQGLGSTVADWSRPPKEIIRKVGTGRLFDANEFIGHHRSREETTGGAGTPPVSPANSVGEPGATTEPIHGRDRAGKNDPTVPRRSPKRPSGSSGTVRTGVKPGSQPEAGDANRSPAAGNTDSGTGTPVAPSTPAPTPHAPEQLPPGQPPAGQSPAGPQQEDGKSTNPEAPSWEYDENEEEEPHEDEDKDDSPSRRGKPGGN